MPGWGLSFGIMLTMLSVVVLIPVAVLLWRGFIDFGGAAIWEVLNRPRVWSVLAPSFRAALVASLFNLVFGVILAWVLVRYRFPGRRIIDAAVDLPTAYTELGIWVAPIFVGLPFVVRTVQPVIEEIYRETEEASATLGATRLRTITRVILPMLAPAALTGFALALARSVGEYGSVIFIAGNLPNLTEIAPLLIVVRLEEFDYNGAVAIAIAMLAISFTLLLAINLIQVWSRHRMGAV